MNVKLIIEPGGVGHTVCARTPVEIPTRDDELPRIHRLVYHGMLLEAQAGQGHIATGINTHRDDTLPTSMATLVNQPHIFLRAFRLVNNGAANQTVDGAPSVVVDVPGGILITPRFEWIFFNSGGLTTYPSLEIFYSTERVSPRIREHYLRDELAGD